MTRSLQQTGNSLSLRSRVSTTRDSSKNGSGGLGSANTGVQGGADNPEIAATQDGSAEEPARPAVAKQV